MFLPLDNAIKIEKVQTNRWRQLIVESCDSLIPSYVARLGKRQRRMFSAIRVYGGIRIGVTHR
ncbi:Uncharacterised protein [Mobiluncus curtisii subsp. curtisii]|nr:Uncharacterised protein [Mobiluncus curtisii subsp. curtisii]STY88312.1 Uncharacterised protein [Mobiluncus holmesii]